MQVNHHNIKSKKKIIKNLTSHPGQLSLVILSGVDARSTNRSRVSKQVLLVLKRKSVSGSRWIKKWCHVARVRKNFTVLLMSIEIRHWWKWTNEYVSSENVLDERSEVKSFATFTLLITVMYIYDQYPQSFSHFKPSTVAARGRYSRPIQPL